MTERPPDELIRCDQKIAFKPGCGEINGKTESWPGRVYCPILLWWRKLNLRNLAVGVELALKSDL